MGIYHDNHHIYLKTYVAVLKIAILMQRLIEFFFHIIMGTISIN